jgi:nicotinate-nucleotide adenylyltransferase
MADPIALLGTSADPPTRGHQALLQGLLSLYGDVATWASDNPMKQHGAPLGLRAQLLQALVNEIGDPRLRLQQDLSSPFTVSTLERAQALWPGRALIFVVGSDLAAQIPRWRQADQWLSQCRLAIAPRQGWPLQPNALEALRSLGAQVELLDLTVPASASSQLRQAPEPAQVPAAVWPLLLEHNLYGLTPSRC